MKNEKEKMEVEGDLSQISIVPYEPFPSEIAFVKIPAIIVAFISLALVFT